MFQPRPLTVRKVFDEFLGIARTAGKDSMVRLINRGILTGLQADTFYALHKAYIGMNRQTPFSKATISQLFNAGNLRLIRKRNVVDSIGLYAARIDYFEKQLTIN